MMTKEQEVERGRQAAAILENPAFREAVEALEKTYTDDWRNTPAPDAQGRERLYVALQVSRDFSAQLVSMIATGKISAQQLAKLRTAK
ncbi:hypothetical protein P0D88_34800 [Paraburkholderia sp. RL18-103-BIB-C]|uniref:hypothetical protein n=1 Tax=Paraburkholderia sp. RL18-103-BIB-C TaxID=3031637 RepID=UPI0038BD7420